MFLMRTCQECKFVYVSRVSGVESAVMTRRKVNGIRVLSTQLSEHFLNSSPRRCLFRMKTDLPCAVLSQFRQTCLVWFYLNLYSGSYCILMDGSTAKILVGWTEGLRSDRGRRVPSRRSWARRFWWWTRPVEGDSSCRRRRCPPALYMRSSDLSARHLG